MNDTRLILAALGALLAFTPQPWAKDRIEYVADRWIVILEDAPMVAFEGEAVPLGAVASARSPLAPTAPSVTGAARLDVTTPAARAYAAYLQDRRQRVLAAASAQLGYALQPVHTFEVLTNGFSVRGSAADARQLAALPGVKEVHPVQMHRPLLDTASGVIGADLVWAGATSDPSQGEGQIIGVIDTGINWSSPYFSDQVPGYVYSNPYGSGLGGCQTAQVTCNNKLVGVYDFTDEGTHGRDVDGHGSHVASIAAGNPVVFEGRPTSGIAPRAHIVSYKVCSHDAEEGRVTCQSDAILQALDQAAADQVDVINYSLGGSPSNPWTSAIPQAFLNLREAGIVGVAAAGNDGPEPGTIRSPANAPWVLGIGNSTHGRLFGNRVDAAGLSGLVGILGNGLHPSSNITATLRDAESVVPGNRLGCSPYPANSLSGAMVLVQRGDCLFREKVDFAAVAGAVAVLVFNNVDGAPITMDMGGGTSIPAVMLGLSDGLDVKAALAATSGATATLHAETTALVSEHLGNRMASSSSRGPNPQPTGIMKPNLAAPGSSILGAGTGANQFAILSGTSMASPMVAGAAALLRQLHPHWTPAMIQSALETTADQGILRNHDGGFADVNARGAGRLQVNEAARAALHLEATRMDFISGQSVPHTLNLSGVVASGCVSGCSFTRRLTASQAGSWAVQTTGELQIDVSPASFSLLTGQSVTLQIVITTPGNLSGAAADGAIQLVPSGNQLAPQKLTVGIDGSVVTEIVAQNNRGRAEVQLAGILPTDELTMASTSLVALKSTSKSVPQDTNRDDPYDGDAGTFVVWLEVPEDTAMIYVDTLPSTAVDVDLFVGRRDQLTDLHPLESSERCRSTTPDDLEQCVLSYPEAGDWWVLVQNWQGSPGAGDDAITVRTAVVPTGEDYSLSATGAGRHAGGLLPLRVAWDVPAMRRNETWVGAIALHTDPAGPGLPVLFPLTLRRDVALVPQHTAIVPYAGPYPVIVPAGGKHDRLFVDMPQAAPEISLIATENGVSAALAYLPFDALAGTEPVTPPAPDEIVSGPVGLNQNESVTLSVTGSEPQRPGRYYVVLENAAATEQRVDVMLVHHTSTPVSRNLSPNPRMGLWSPLHRSTGQGIAWDRAGEGFITWYSYEEDGSPAFYLAAGPIAGGEPFWSGTMHRFTATDPQRRHGELVGRASLAVLAADDLIFSWEIFGQHGSERMKPLASAACRDGQSLTGLWRVPAMAYGGTTVVMNPATRAYVRYYFDDLGLPRWLITGAELGDDTLEALDWRGYCPYCDPAERSFDVAGTYRMDFWSERHAHEYIDAVSGAPVSFDFQFDHEVEKLSEDMECL